MIEIIRKLCVLVFIILFSPLLIAGLYFDFITNDDTTKGIISDLWNKE